MRVGALGVIAFALVLQTASSAAESMVTYVSGRGDDTQPCDDPARPCETLARAIARTSAGGVVRVLSSVPRGAATITKPLTIIGDGPDAGTAAVYGPISVAAGTYDVVVLRGLLVQFNPILIFGPFETIRFETGAALHLENCRIGPSETGIGFYPRGSSELFVSDCQISDSRNVAVAVTASGTGRANVILDRAAISSHASGIFIHAIAPAAELNLVVRDSVLERNRSAGLFYQARPAGDGPVRISVDGTVLANSSCGIAVIGDNANVRISRSVVTRNRTALYGNVHVSTDSAVRGNEDDPTEELAAPPANPPPRC